MAGDADERGREERADTTRYGSVTLTFHGGALTQVNRDEKIRPIGEKI